MSNLLIPRNDVGLIWWDLLTRLTEVKNPIKPRDIPCYEITGVTLYLEDARNNIILNETRNLNYRFMVAEWLYIWFGHDDVATIARYNKPIAAFSDNGVDFNGAYGPPVVMQWQRVRDLLLNDPDTRQAVMLIYRVPTGPTKDVPCTLTLQFFQRNGQLDVVVCMRSSDVWLGLPYDVFNFTMLGNIMSAQLNLVLGSLTLHLGSSHLYEVNRAAAEQILMSGMVDHLTSPQFTDSPPTDLDDVLMHPTVLQVDTRLHTEPWRCYCRVLASPTKARALEVLREIE